MITLRTDLAVEQVLKALTRKGMSRSEVVRTAILDAERAQRRARLRTEADSLRNNPDDVAASRELAAQMSDISAW